MLIITIKIPRLDRAIRSICIAAQAPVKAFNKTILEICGAVGKRPHPPSTRSKKGELR